MKLSTILFSLIYVEIFMFMLFAFPVKGFEFELTVSTDKTWYYAEEIVYVFGNFTQTGVGTTINGRVGLEIVPPGGSTMHTQKIFRVIRTGDGSLEEGPMLIFETFPCDDSLGEVHTFTRTGYTYFHCYIRIRNFGDKTVDSMWYTVNIFDSNLHFLGAAVATFTNLPPGAEYEIKARADILIPNWASLGTAFMCVNLFSDLPSHGGYPYCREKTDTFQIVSGGGGSLAKTQETLLSETLNENSAYHTAFQIPSANLRLGTYQVYVSGAYAGYQKQPSLMSYTTFKLTIPGDVDGDNDVDSSDLFAVAAAFGTKQGDPLYNSACDFDHDNDVDSLDLFALAANYGIKSKS